MTTTEASTPPPRLATALSTLEEWLIDNPTELKRYLGGTADFKPATPVLSRLYDTEFTAGDNYRATLPDIQNAPPLQTCRAQRKIQRVGIADFRLPLLYSTKSGETLQLETSVTGAVSLAAEKRGINMSRIMRTFYSSRSSIMTFSTLQELLQAYLNDLEAAEAQLQLHFSLPIERSSLRSGLSGYQFYQSTLDCTLEHGSFSRAIHLDYVYSSTCPCSLELSEHARESRHRLATPHSQRSLALVSVMLAEDVQEYTVEELIDHCRVAIPTETQVMVKREDEQAFAELNAANPIFVEDAVRRIAEQLESDDRIEDFRIRAQHKESLHSHDAISVLSRGPTFDCTIREPTAFAQRSRC